MRILVVNRIDDSTCAEAMRLIPGTDVRVVDKEHSVEVCTAFAPQVVILWDPMASKLPVRVFREHAGSRIFPRGSLLMDDPPYRSVKQAGFDLNYIFSGKIDLSELAIRVVEECVPEVSVYITDPDKFWQELLKKYFSEIPGVKVYVHDDIRFSDAVHDFAFDIIVMVWLDTLSPNSIRRYAQNRIDLKIAVFSDAPVRDISRQSPDVDFVLSKSSPVEALTLVVKEWTEQIQLRKRDELREGLLRNQRQASRSS